MRAFVLAGWLLASLAVLAACTTVPGPRPPTVVTTAAVASRLDAFMRAGGNALSNGQPAEAERAFAAAVSEAEKFGSMNVRLGWSLAWLALAQGRQGKHVEARRTVERAMPLLELAAESGDPAVTFALVPIAMTQVLGSQPAQAQRVFEIGLKIAERALGAEHPLVGGFLAGLAASHVLQYRNRDVDPMLERALGIADKVASRPNAVRRRATVSDFLVATEAVLASMLELAAEARVAHGDFARAESLLQRAVTIYQRIGEVRDAARAESRLGVVRGVSARPSAVR